VSRKKQIIPVEKAADLVPKMVADPADVLHKHHVFIGLGSLIAILGIVLSLFVTSRTKKIAAAPNTVIEIVQPLKDTVRFSSLATKMALAMPAADIMLTPEVSISAHDGIPVYADGSSIFGLLKRDNVLMTTPLAKFVQTLSKYFSDNKMQALISSGVRSSARQLDIIKERIAEYGQLANFPELKTAAVSDTAKWLSAWQWLTARHVPVNPPADITNDEGSKFGGSLHLKGLAMDVVSDDLDALKQAIEVYKIESEKTRSKGLHISSTLRERDCVHISLTN
jgi:hypothetical protein